MDANLTTLPTTGIYLDKPLPPTQDPALVYLNHFESAKSRYTQSRVVLAIASWLNRDPRLINWSAFTHEHNAAIQNRAVQFFKPATARKYQAALRGIAESAWVLGHMTAEAYQRAVRLPTIKGKSRRKDRFVSQGEINAIMDACISYPSPAGPRDAVIIALTYMALIRREGIINLDLEDYQEVEKDGRRVGQLIVHYKGGDDDTAYLTGEAHFAINDWLAIRGSKPGPLLLRVSQLGRLVYTGHKAPGRPHTRHEGKEDWADRLSDQAVYVIVKKRAEQAGVKNISPNVFRHTGIGRMLKNKVDLVTVSHIAHHKSVQTTGGYDPRGDEEKIEGASSLHIKWIPRTISPA